MSSNDQNNQIRSDEQLLILLKLVDVNEIETKRRNVNVRHKIWNNIAEKLNRLSANGAEKDGAGWKRCFKTWRVSMGSDYKTKMQEFIKLVPPNGNYRIKVSDDEDETESNSEGNIILGQPIEKQKQLLHELVLKHRMLLLSTAKDEQLKARLWQNISEQLNAVEDGLTLSPLQWKQSIDLNKYRTKKGRKPKNSSSNDHGFNLSLASKDETTPPSTSCQKQLNENTTKPAHPLNEAIKEIDRKLEERGNDDDDDTSSTSESNSSSSDDSSDTNILEPERKRPRPSPLVNNFKFSSRMVCAVEQLRDDVQCINNTLKQTTDSLDHIRNVLERQFEQQEEFNALLKRSNQLLKVLVEFKIGKRTSVTKKNYQISNE